MGSCKFHEPQLPGRLGRSLPATLGMARDLCKMVHRGDPQSSPWSIRWRWILFAEAQSFDTQSNRLSIEEAPLDWHDFFLLPYFPTGPVKATPDQDFPPRVHCGTFKVLEKSDKTHSRLRPATGLGRSGEQKYNNSAESVRTEQKNVMHYLFGI